MPYSSDKSADTSPKVASTTASSNSPRSGYPVREKATAPALSRAIAVARLIALALCGHSTGVPAVSVLFSP